MQIFVEDLDGRTRTLDVDAATTAADIVGDGKLLHNGNFITGSLRDANVQKDATLHVVECLRGGMPDREYNSSDEDSVTTDSNAGQEEEEDSSDYESSDDETTLPQVTTLESVLAMIPFTPDWWEARAANEALHNRRKMVAETNRAKHLVKLCEAGMHADALREQLHDSAQDFTDFNHVKDAMIKHEQWVWKPPRSMIKSAEASGADKSKLESSAVLRKVQRDFRMMTLDRPGEKPMHLQAWPSVLKKERKHAQMMAELLGKEVAPEKQLEEMRRKMRCDVGVPLCRDAFTPSTRLVSRNDGSGWFLVGF